MGSDSWGPGSGFPRWLIKDVQLFLGSASGYGSVNLCQYKETVRVFDTYVPTLLFRTGDSRFERTAQFLTFVAESSRFEMALAKMSGLYEFCKMITLFTNFRWKFWPLVTKLGACAALVYHFHHEQLIRVNKSTNCFFKSERCTENESENQ